MNKNILTVAFIFAAAMCLPEFVLYGSGIPNRPDYCGVWGIWGGHEISAEGKQWYKGTIVTIRWKNIEPD